MVTNLTRASIACIAILTGLITFGCNSGDSAAPANTTGGTSAASGGTYNGPYNKAVHQLLANAQAAGVHFSYPKSANDPNTSSDVPDTIKTMNITTNSCQRDSLVAAAIAAAWAAEAHARIGNPSAAQDNAVNEMLPSLKSADTLCSDAPVIGAPMACVTEKVWNCTDAGTEKP